MMHDDLRSMLFGSQSQAVSFIKQVTVLDYRPTTGDLVNQTAERTCLECRMGDFDGNLDRCSSLKYILIGCWCMSIIL